MESDGTNGADHAGALREVVVGAADGGAADGGAPPPSEAELRAELAADAPAFMSSVITFRVRQDADAGSPVSRKNQMAASMTRLASTREAGGGKPGASAEARCLRITLDWRRLRYTIPLGKKRPSKVILDGLSGRLPSGRMLAVIGPSGSGKTSLLNALSGRLPVGGALEGAVSVNGVPRGAGFRRATAYVMQDDALFSNLTVRETLRFAAALRLPAAVPAADKRTLVEEVIAELGLARAADTRIGGPFARGVSGGERKRTNIAVELLSNPSLIFVDEPTSGLDAAQAQNVVEALASLAAAGRAVMATVHQPRSSIFRMFDLLLVLSEGREVYFGDAARAVAWFGAAGFQCPPEYNPADFILDVASTDARGPSDEAASRRRMRLLADLHARCKAAAPAGAAADAGADVEAAAALAAPGARAFANGRAAEFRVLLARSWAQSSRDRMPQKITLIQTTFIGFVLAALYSSMGKTQTGIQDEVGFLFFCTIFAAFNALFGALNTFPVERGIVNRERASRAYHVSPYYVARFLTELPLRVAQSALFSCIVYWIVGLNPTAAAFFIFMALLLATGLSSQALGVAISAGARNEKVALAMAPAFTVLLILFGGFYANTDTIPDWLSWLQYLSHAYWGFLGLAVNDFSGRTGWTCGDGGNSTSSSSSAECAGCLTTGDEILDRLGFGSAHVWQAFVGLAALIVGFNLLGYSLLRWTKPKYLPLTAVDGGAGGGGGGGAAPAAAAGGSAAAEAKRGA